MDQELADALQWYVDHFQTERERAAYKAGFQQGSAKARALISIHGNIELADPRR